MKPVSTSVLPSPQPARWNSGGCFWPSQAAADEKGSYEGPPRPGPGGHLARLLRNRTPDEPRSDGPSVGCSPTGEVGRRRPDTQARRTDSARAKVDQTPANSKTFSGP